MKQKLSNYIAEKLLASGITDVFMITGGGAMHLDDALGHQEGLHCLYNHHEQACAIAAESYARIHNKIAALCVTTGPGGTNAMTGVVGGFLDSIPMLVISGQVRFDTTARSTGLALRAMGDQEFDICKAIDCMTKYSEMVIDPMRIRYCLEKALYLANSGRKGPSWLDIPLNVQGAYVETDELIGFDPVDYENGGNGWAEKKNVPAIPEDEAGEGEKRQVLPKKVTEEIAKAIIEKIRQAKRPVINAGNGIRLAGAHETFLKVAEKLGIPVVTGWDSEDCIWDEHPLYVGRGGNMGDRPGNFAIQNSDLVLSIGSRLSIRQVGYNYKTWARAAYVIVNDIDENGYYSKESSILSISAEGWENSGGDIALCDLNNNGILDMVLLCTDKPTTAGRAYRWYYVAYDLKPDGHYNSLSSLNTLDELGFFYDGAGIDICDINKNGTPDLLMMVYDAPEGENSFRYQIAFDLQSNGNYLSLSPVYEVPGLGHDGDGAGVAVGDIDNNGTLDILFMALDAPSGKDKFVYEILPDIDKYGNSYAKPIYTPRFPDSLSPCDTGQGAACCLYDLDNNGFLDAIFVAIENIKGKSNSWKYVTGHNLNKQGVPMCWR